VLPVLDPGHNLPLGRGIALQLVGDEHTRSSTLLSEELRNRRLAAFLSRRLSWSTARHSQCFSPAMLMTTSSSAICRHGKALADGCDWRILGRI